MSSPAELFHAEFGQYIQTVSDSNKIGVCSKCLTVRSRDEVDAQERCPADLVRLGLEDLSRAGQHEWVGFTESAKLEEFLKSSFRQFKQLAEQAAAAVRIDAADDED